MKKSLLIELFERRVPYSLGVYIGAVWVIVEITQRLVDRYLFSPYVTDIVFWGLFSLLPAVCLVAWTHGPPGADKVTKTELVGVPINVLFSLVFLITVYSSKDLSAAVDRISIVDEQGRSAQQLVARAPFRQRILLYFWNNLPDNTAIEQRNSFAQTSSWERFAIQQLLRDQLEQTPFLTVTGPLQGTTNQIRNRLTRAGYPLGVEAPLELQADIARDHNYRFFITGDLRLEKDGYALVAKLYDSLTLELMTRINVNGQPLPEAAEYIAYQVKEYLSIPGNHRRLNLDLETPVSEFCTSEQVALRDFTRGQIAWLLRNNVQRGRTLFQAALDKDPGYFSAILELMKLEYRDGNAIAAQDWISRAQQRAVSLPERKQAQLRLLVYRLRNDAERELKLLQTQVELYPNDTYWLVQLGEFYVYRNAVDLARDTFLALLEIDPQAVEAMRAMVALTIAGNGFNDSSLKAAMQWIDRMLEVIPNDYSVYLLQGDLQLRDGDLYAAREAYLKAQVLDSSTIDPLLKLAGLASCNGDFARSEALFEEAEMMLFNDEQRDKLLQVRSLDKQRQGQIQAAIELTLQRRELQALDQLDSVFRIETRLIQLHALIGEFTAAEAILAKANERLEPPLRDYLEISQAQLAVLRAQYSQGADVLGQAALMISDHNAVHLEGLVASIRGDLARGQQRWDDAFSAYAKAGTASYEHNSVIDTELQSHTIAGQAVAAHYLGRSEEAGDLINRQLNRDGYHPEIWLARAEIQYSTGQLALANASVQTALAVLAKADEAYYLYRRAQQLQQAIDAKLG